MTHARRRSGRAGPSGGERQQQLQVDGQEHPAGDPDKGAQGALRQVRAFYLAAWFVPLCLIFEICGRSSLACVVCTCPRVLTLAAHKRYGEVANITLCFSTASLGTLFPCLIFLGLSSQHTARDDKLRRVCSATEVETVCRPRHRDIHHAGRRGPRG